MIQARRINWEHASFSHKQEPIVGTLHNKKLFEVSKNGIRWGFTFIAEHLRGYVDDKAQTYRLKKIKALAQNGLNTYAEGLVDAQ